MARTLDDIRDRCRMEGDHWLWAGALSEGVPRIYAPEHTRSGGAMAPQVGRRAVWHVVHGKPIPKGWRVFRTCAEPLCVNPEHATCEPPAKRGRKVSASGVLRGNVRKILASRSTGRQRSHLTRETVALILASPKTGTELAAELGLGRTVVSGVRTGRAKAWQPVGGLFAGLIGSAA